MSQFYGTLKGSRGEATRCGTITSGLLTTAASWAGAVRVHLWTDAFGSERYSVELVSWQGHGVCVDICRGFVGQPPYWVNPELIPTAEPATP